MFQLGSEAVLTLVGWTEPGPGEEVDHGTVRSGRAKEIRRNSDMTSAVRRRLLNPNKVTTITRLVVP